MPEPATLTQTVEISVTAAASPETISRFISDPAWFARWMGADSTIEPQPGGAVRVLYPQGQIASGRLVEIEPPRRVVFTWGFEGDDSTVPPGSTTVEVTLTPLAEGTRITLRHQGIPNEEMAWGSAQGWRFSTAALANQAAIAQFGAGLEALVDAWMQAWAERNAQARRALLERCFGEDGTFRDAFAVVEGRAALDDRIATQLAWGAPASLERSGPVQQCHAAIRFPWRAIAPDGTVVGSGTNFGQLALSGVLREVVGFWDAAP